MSTPSPSGSKAALLRQAMVTLEPRLKLVEAFIARELEAGPEVIQQTGSYVFSAGGKRLRPTLLLLVSRLVGYQGEKDVRYAALIEMLHTATLVHDDLIDGSLMRRGAETLNARWSPAATVLTGDYLFARAAYLVARTGNV
ncbi:MAG: polyprenyl synthetase family protein, partial [Thermoanaerobaculum sp.]